MADPAGGIPAVAARIERAVVRCGRVEPAEMVVEIPRGNAAMAAQQPLEPFKRFRSGYAYEARY